ncbi:O-methyltransferase [Paenibacillus sp. RU4T]
MMPIWTQVDDYIEDRLIEADRVLSEVLSANRREGLPEIDVTAAQGKLLQLLVRMKGARRILEIGTLGGYSTIWMARALPEDGTLVSLELEPHHADVARSNIALAGLEAQAEVRTGDARASLEEMEKAGIEPFDFIFIDADKPNNPAYLKSALRLSRPGTVIIGDNIVRGGEVVGRHSTDPRVHGVRAFIDLMAAEARLSATAIQTVGRKGYDGFALAIVQD